MTKKITFREERTYLLAFSLINFRAMVSPMLQTLARFIKKYGQALEFRVNALFLRFLPIKQVIQGEISQTTL